jgi:alkylation response protein AidB-like acyl-CoA dehydrogenase
LTLCARILAFASGARHWWAVAAGSRLRRPVPGWRIAPPQTVPDHQDDAADDPPIIDVLAPPIAYPTHRKHFPSHPADEQTRIRRAFACTMVEASVCLANEMVGGADRLREDALAYSMMRMQFGKPIASFQSMKHKQADMLLEVELAKSAAYYAATSLDDGDDDAVPNAHLAKACASDTYMQTAIHAVQIHGGIGFTWDNDTHLWFKRAKSSEVLLGDASYHRELMMQNWAA